jgi:nucleoside-diphosphate-sugar epimerase
MPVIVIGADTQIGHAIVPALRPASGELRLFASDPDAVAAYRPFAKVAVGDISDGSHVGAAAIGAFCAIVIAAAAHDDRERYFAAGPDELFAQWADGLADAGVTRIIVVGNPDEIPRPNPLEATSSDYHHADTRNRNLEDIATVVAQLESAR